MNFPKRAARGVSVAVLLAAAGGCGSGDRQARETGQALRERLSGPPPEGLGPRAELLWKSARRFYEKNGYTPVWVSAKGVAPRAQELEAARQGVLADGLDPSSYDLKPAEPLQPREGRSWNPLRRRVPAAQLAEAEVRYAAAYLKLASDLLVGRVEPAKVDPHWFGQYRLSAPERLLERAVATKSVEASLSELVPRHPQYATLRQAMQRYRDIAARGGWPTGFKPAPVDAAALRARLAAEGDVPAGTAASAGGTGLDPALREGLKRFERRHGLVPDGRLDPEVVRELNVPVATRLRQIQLNLERWRWLPEHLGERHVIVNLPSFSLAAIDDGRISLSMRVVVGKTENPTPIFSDRMTHVVFSPYWNVPPTIAKEEIRPALMRDPAYLYRNDMEVVRDSRVVSPWSVDWEAGGYTVRQRPGAKNALGQVKFIFPNNFDVYLHDTPADQLFATNERTFSHGCVRVEKPEELARWVLRGQEEWTPERIQAAMRAGREKHVAVKDPIPVYLVYATAWVEGDGSVSFRDDVYGHDRKQIKLLPPSPPPVQVAQASAPAAARGR
jgi:murein L,D-transpeptidase YcbB/YkuD